MGGDGREGTFYRNRIFRNIACAVVRSGVFRCRPGPSVIVVACCWMQVAGVPYLLSGPRCRPGVLWHLRFQLIPASIDHSGSHLGFGYLVLSPKLFFLAGRPVMLVGSSLTIHPISIRAQCSAALRFRFGISSPVFSPASSGKFREPFLAMRDPSTSVFDATISSSTPDGASPRYAEISRVA